jgi:hypothetical protein
MRTKTTAGPLRGDGILPSGGFRLQKLAVYAVERFEGAALLLADEQEPEGAGKEQGQQ